MNRQENNNNVFVYVCVGMFMCMYAFKCACMCVRACVCACMHACVSVWVGVRTYACTHMHVCVCVCTCRCVQRLWLKKNGLPVPTLKNSCLTMCRGHINHKILAQLLHLFIFLWTINAFLVQLRVTGCHLKKWHIHIQDTTKPNVWWILIIFIHEIYQAPTMWLKVLNKWVR